MHILGLVGGIASGKSAVAAEFAALGAVLLDADKAAHEVINLPATRSELVARWGQDILLPSGGIDRSAVAQRVFAESPRGAADLRFLERTLHPCIRKRFEAALSSLADGKNSVAVIDAPLLLEAEWADLCDTVVFVDCPRKKRLERAGRRNWTAAQFAAREAAQMPIEEKKRRATEKIVNTDSPAELGEQVQALWREIRSAGGNS